KNKMIDIITQVGLERDPEFSHIPLMLDLAKSDESRQVLKFFSTDVVIGRPFVTSPGVPADRVALLRKAFDDTMKDPAFVQEAAAAGIDLNPVAGEKIQKIVADLIATPDNIVTKAKLAMDAKDPR
ncbi:MAG TPA: hypothetical protein VK148_16225, partial [Xanthobacteraceae bacterium]|nr:hypothetical protein [Xanthobacteraceae bacterium]